MIYERIPALASTSSAASGRRRCSNRLLLPAPRHWPISMWPRLYDFFHRSRGVSLFPAADDSTAAVADGRDAELAALSFANTNVTACERLFALVRRKDDLDFHAARQGMLKTWLFVHIGLTYALVALALSARVAGARVPRRWRVREPAAELFDEPVRTAESAVDVRAFRAWPRMPCRANGAADAALPWPNVRRCATATGGNAIDRRCAADRATKAQRPRAVAAAFKRADRCAACGRNVADSSRPALC